MTAVTLSPRSAAVALASLQARLLAGTPALWAGFGLAVALCTVWSGGARLQWTQFGADSGRAALIPAGVLVLVGHLAASRDHRHGAAEFTGTLPVPPRRRAAALLAFVPVAGAAGALTEVAELLVALPSGLSGRPDPWLAAVPVVTPMIGAALGVAVGLWWPSASAGPLTVFAVAALLAMLPVLGSNPGALPWLLFPTVLDQRVTREAAGWHVLYLAGILAAVTSAALARHRRRWGMILMVAGLVIAVVAVRCQQAESRAAAPAHRASAPTRVVPSHRR